MNKEVSTRLGWVELYNATKNAGQTCKRCGISHPTLHKWVNRYAELGIPGLENKSRRPLHSPKAMITKQIEI